MYKSYKYVIRLHLNKRLRSLVFYKIKHSVLDQLGTLAGMSNAIPSIVKCKHHEVRITGSPIYIGHIIVLLIILPAINVTAPELPVFLKLPDNAWGCSKITAFKLAACIISRLVADRFAT